MRNEGINKLANVFQNRIKNERQAYSELSLDFGEIQNDYSLRTNTYPISIPQEDYLVLRNLTLGEKGDVLTDTQKEGEDNDGKHSHGYSGQHAGQTAGDGGHYHNDEAPHIHDVLIPEKLRWLKPGDRVLVAWVQNDAIVLGVICPATDINQGRTQ